MTANLVVVGVSTGIESSCAVSTYQAPGTCEIVLLVEGGADLRATGYDFEEALQQLRVQLESEGLHLLCNRFRRDAFVSPMSRQMSNGLSCYLVLLGRPVDPERIVPCLDAADRVEVVPAAEADRYIAKWKSVAAPAIVRWLTRLAHR